MTKKDWKKFYYSHKLWMYKFYGFFCVLACCVILTILMLMGDYAPYADTIPYAPLTMISYLISYIYYLVLKIIVQSHLRQDNKEILL